MSQDFSVGRFVKDPSLLVALCREVVEMIDGETDSEEAATMEAQLREIANTVERLEKIGVAVPDGLRAEKIRLSAALDVKKESSFALNLLQEGLEKVLKDLKTRLGHVKRSSVSGKRKRRTSSSGKNHTHQSEMISCLIESLEELGGSAHCNEVLDLMGQKLQGKFMPGDLEYDKSHSVKWRHNAHWARLKLANDGVLVKHSPRGYWQLSKVQQ